MLHELHNANSVISVSFGKLRCRTQQSSNAHLSVVQRALTSATTLPLCSSDLHLTYALTLVTHVFIGVTAMCYMHNS
jgi:hypothetical protein